MTKKEMLKNIISFVETGNCEAYPHEIVEFCSHEIELLDKKTSTPKKPTATQIENESFKSTLVAALTSADAPKSIKEIQSEVPEVSELSNQRITHLLSDLVKNGTLIKTYVKKTPYYTIA